MRKKKELRYTKAEVARAMKEFRVSTVGEVLFNLWAMEREKILVRGKKEHNMQDWYTLEGFDAAISLIDKWASINTEAPSAPTEE